jgi:lipopolysaccharide export system protein LptA
MDIIYHMTNFISPVFKKPLIRLWITSLSPARIANRWSLISLPSACKASVPRHTASLLHALARYRTSRAYAYATYLRPAGNYPAYRCISIAAKKPSHQPASCRLIQQFLKHIYSVHLSIITGLVLFCLQTNIYAASSTEKVLISADHMHLNIVSGHSVYTGNVRISQGKLVLSGDKVTIEQHNNEIESITVIGKPARYNNVTEKGEPIMAESEHMQYRASQNKLEMNTNAILQQPGHQVSSQKIVYDTLKRIIIAGGGNTPTSNNATLDASTDAKQSQRVNITLTPKKQLSPSEESAAE